MKVVANRLQSLVAVPPHQVDEDIPQGAALSSNWLSKLFDFFNLRIENRGDMSNVLLHGDARLHEPTHRRGLLQRAHCAASPHGQNIPAAQNRLKRPGSRVSAHFRGNQFLDHTG